MRPRPSRFGALQGSYALSPRLRDTSTMYDLHTLGWSSFQQLCLTVTRHVLGQTVESFLDSQDGGRDGAFTGTWKRAGLEALHGAFVIQCKHTSKRDYILTKSDLTDEIQKAGRLVEHGHCDSYVLMTNAGVPGTRAAEITACFRAVGVKCVLVLGQTWITQQIRETKRLRMLVPRVYGLGDLGEILDERAYGQARAILESMREDLAKVVVTDAYQKAADAIDTCGFVLLIGEPAAGKTTIASMLAMAAVDQWQASVLKLDDPGKVVDHWNPQEQSQFFWLDDAFGVQQYEDFLVRRWNHALSQVRTMLDRGAKIVMTSRDYIYNGAREDLKEGAFPLLRESKVVIDVHALSREEKRQILYNHLKLGRQPLSFRKEIKPHLEGIADHPRFIPETARRLADPLFTKDVFLDRYYLDQFVERREQLLQEVVQGLDRHSKAALALIYMRNGQLKSPIVLEDSEIEAFKRLSSDLSGCVAALAALDGSLVQLSRAGGDSVWGFKHPTIGDAYATILVRSPEHLDIYIQGTATDSLLYQVTCGDVGVEKAIILPRSLFPQMILKLQAIGPSEAYKSPTLSAFGGRGELQGFLARRCSKEFLTLYIAREPQLLDNVAEPGLFLDSVPEVRLAQRLHEFDLLPEAKRRTFVETVSEYAVEGHDMSALEDDRIRALFTEQEDSGLVGRVRAELLPRLDDVRMDWEMNHPSTQRPDEYMDQLLVWFDTLKRIFPDDGVATGIIEQEAEAAREWILEKTPDEPARSPRRLGTVETTEAPQGERSIFDDIDHAQNEPSPSET